MMWRYAPYYGGNLGWWAVVPIVGQILFWIVIALTIASIFRHNRGHGQNEDQDSALRILKERYAWGEMDKKEFEEKKKDLMEH